MLFNSLEFLIFFPIAVIAYYIFPKKIRNYWLLVCSYYFYMCWNPKYIFLLMTTTILTYLSGLLMEQIRESTDNIVIIQKRKKIICASSIVVNLLLLFYFKYIDFGIEIWKNTLSLIGIKIVSPVFDIVLPVGISFYIFQALSYTIDVYREEIYAEKNIFRYALFVSFFPQLVAGPIERPKNLLKQLAKPGIFVYENVRDGLLTMLWGYFLKLVIADRCAVVVDMVYRNVDGYLGYQLIFASILFTMQIYCDFMSYSTIARGAAKVLGYNLMENFNTPYFATSIHDFWHRWHISLSTWLRDYVYIPLGGNKRGTIRKQVNVLITFLISGLWHGAAYTFVIWGLFHGICQILEDIIKPLGECPKNWILKCIKIAWNFILVDLAWILFRAESLRDAMTVYRNMWYYNRLDVIKNGIMELGLDTFNLYVLLIGCLILFISSLMRSLGINLREWLASKVFVFRYACYWTVVIMIMLSLNIAPNEFIYFQF